MRRRTRATPPKQRCPHLRNWCIGLAITAVGVIASYIWLDQPIAFFVHRNVTDKTKFVWLHRLPVAFLLVSFLVLAWCGLWTLMDRAYSRIQSVGLACCISFIATNFVNNGLKYVFGRVWPETWIDNNPSLIQNGLFGFTPLHGGSGFAAFPSGHTAVTCSVMTVLWCSYPSLRPICVASVVAVAIGLIGANYHFLSDILSGIFVGISTGYITLKMSPACVQSDQHNRVDALRPRDGHRFRLALLCAFTAAGTFIGESVVASAQSRDALLQIEAKISLGDVRGRIDHMAVDVNRRRLFVAELGNNSVGIVDVGQAKVLQVLSGLKEPQGVGYLPGTDTLYVANGGDGSLRLFQGPNYTANGRIDFGDDADNVRVDQSNQRVVVGYGAGALAVRLGVFDKRDGFVRTVDTCGDADDVFVDAKRHRVYVSCGAGAIDIFDARSYERLSRLPTVSGARTSLFVPELDRLFLAVRSAGRSPAAIWVLRPEP